MSDLPLSGHLSSEYPLSVQTKYYTVHYSTYVDSLQAILQYLNIMSKSFLCDTHRAYTVTLGLFAFYLFDDALKEKCHFDRLFEGSKHFEPNLTPSSVLGVGLYA